MKNRFDVELEVATDLSPLELGSKIEQAVREALEAVGHSLGCDSVILVVSNVCKYCRSDQP